MENKAQSHFARKPEFTLSYILNHSWECTQGAKWPIWAVALILILISIAVPVITNSLLGEKPTGLSYWVDYIILPIFTNVFTAPFVLGLYMVAIRRTRNEHISAETGFQYFKYYLPATITLIIIGIVSSIPLFIVNWPTFARSLDHTLATANLITILLAAVIYALWFIAIPLIADKNLSVRKALSTSFKLTSPVFMKIFGLILIIYFFVITSLLPLIIGMMLQNMLVAVLGAFIFIAALIWLLPFIFMVPGVIYWLLVDKP